MQTRTANRPLFAYGTLRDADVLALVLGRRAAGLSLADATAPGHAVSVFPGRSYPLIRPAPGVTAPGLLIGGLGPQDLAVLDAFEGDEYRRGGIELIVSGARLLADVYWPRRTAEATPEWQLEDWVRDHKPDFLAAEAAAAGRRERSATRHGCSLSGAPPGDLVEPKPNPRLARNRERGEL